MNSTHFNFKHCHKWASLLKRRKQIIDQACDAVNSGNFTMAKNLTYGVLNGDIAASDPGMEGSLLYHMAMITKMTAESRLIISELNLQPPQITKQLRNFYHDFTSDVKLLLIGMEKKEINWKNVLEKPVIAESEKIGVYQRLVERSLEVIDMLEKEDSNSGKSLQELFKEWASSVIEMRLRQEYHTIRGFFIVKELAEKLGITRLQEVMRSVQTKFGEETVDIALNVTLKVGKERKDLQSIMLSDHYIEREMNMGQLKGAMRFLNCPVFGSHNYIIQKLGIRPDVSSLFCRFFCFAHAKAMLKVVLPFPFSLTRPKLMCRDGVCEFSLHLARAPDMELKQEKYVPLVLSWNVTLNCNLKCPHCYIDASDRKNFNELNTDAAKMLIHQIAEVSRPLLILSGGEPLLRGDIFELIRYGADRGLSMGMGSNGMLIDAEVANKLKKAGIKTVAVSLDSHVPDKHDQFRGVEGCWEKAVNAIKELKKNDVVVQVNTTVTKQNYSKIDDIVSLAEGLGVDNFHLFFLVPTGRGSAMDDISPAMYEEEIRYVLAQNSKRNLKVKPSCAPQFMRIAKQMDIDTTHWIRGCLAGLYYCRIYPNGEVTPCPYLPIPLGNIRETAFKDIWFNSEVLRDLRNFDRLKGKCGICSYHDICGGCRARAYGVTRSFADQCGGLHDSSKLRGDYLAEDPWCVYDPKKPH